MALSLVFEEARIEVEEFNWKAGPVLDRCTVTLNIQLVSYYDGMCGTAAQTLSLAPPILSRSVPLLSPYYY